MEAFSALLAGPSEAEARLFHTTSGIASLLAQVLSPQSEEEQFCGSGVVRLRANAEEDETACFDHMVLTPSYGRLSGNQWQENRIIRAGLERLRPGGTCVCIVSNGWLARHSPDDVEMRQLLVEEYRLTRLLLLPPHTFGSEVKASAIFVEKRPPEETGILVTDLRGAATGPAFLKALCEVSEEGHRLARAQLRMQDYILLPEAYVSSEKLIQGPQSLEELDRALRLLYHKAEESGRRPEQFSLFCAEPTSPVRDPETVRRLIELEYKRLDFLFAAKCAAEDWPQRTGRSLFTLRNGLECREEIRGEGYPLFTAAGFSGFARTANVTELLPNLVISRVGAYCGQVYRVWEKCPVSANAMYLTQIDENLPLDLLLLLLRAAGLNRLKRGSAQPYITQDVALDCTYSVPPAARAQVLLEAFGSDFKRIRGLELELITGSRR